MGGDKGERSNKTTQTCNSQSIFWDSPEAANVFVCVCEIYNVFKVLSDRVNLLTDSIQTAHGYKNIIDGNEEHLSQHDVLQFIIIVFSCTKLTSLLKKDWEWKQ